MPQLKWQDVAKDPKPRPSEKEPEPPEAAALGTSGSMSRHVNVDLVWEDIRWGG